jgi:hypothetical protein
MTRHDVSAAVRPTASALPSPKQLVWLIVRSPGSRSAEEAAAIVRVDQDRDTATLIRLVQRLVELICRTGVTNKDRVDDPVTVFDAWLADARACGVPALEAFGGGLEKDGAVVRAALTLPWSVEQRASRRADPQAEAAQGAMYGRAKLDLLRQRLLLLAA